MILETCWFEINSMKTHSGKFQFMVLGVKNIASFGLNVNGQIIPCSNEVKLLGIFIDNKLKFKKHIEDLCQQASYKLHTLRRIRGYLLMHLLIASLSMPPLKWMGKHQ